MFTATIFVLICYISCQCTCEEFSCPAAATTSTAAGNLKLSTLPENYRVSIKFVDMIKKFSADVIEYYEKSRNLSVLRCEKDCQTYDCIIDRAAGIFTFVNRTGELVCDTKAIEGGETSFHQESFLLPNASIKLGRQILSISDLIDFINSSSILIVDPANHTDHEDHGIPARHVLACRKSADEMHWLEFKVCLSDKNFSLSGVKKLHSVPTRIDFKVYDIPKTPKVDGKISFNAVYELYGYRLNLQDEDYDYHLPPQGVYCQGRNKTKLIPRFSNDFSISVDYIDVNSQSVDDIKIYYSRPEKLIALDFSWEGKDEPIVSSISRNLEHGHYKVVQDFKSGIQYTLDLYSSKCLRVQGILGNAGGTIGPSQDKRKLSMKDGFQLLFILPQSNYTYVGQRRDNHMDLEVWNAFDVQTPQKDWQINYTYEIWMSSAHWNHDGVNSTNSSFPVLFKVYSTDNYNRKNVTVHKYSNFIQYNERTDVFWPDLNACDCFSPFAEYVTQINDTMENLKNVGIGIVTQALRNKIANVSGVRPIRISSIQFWADDVNKAVNASFAVGKKSTETGAPTSYFEKEVEAKKAMTKFNESISLDDILLDTTTKTGEKKYFALRKGSLSTIKVFPTTSIVRTAVIKPMGYTGGSMAAMGFFMLFIGGGVGIVLAYQYLKRARGGIAYQIYE